MQSVQRKFGKLLNKAPGDNAKVSVVLNDYEDADKVLAQLIENTKSWRDSWASLVDTQLGIVTEYEGLYDPIEGTGRTNAKPAVPTPELQLHRTFKLKETCAELRTDVLEELTQIESIIIKPATDARDCLAPIRKTLKKRENRRLDYEKAQERAVKLQRKPGKTAKEEASLAKAEQEVARTADEFQVVDDHVRETLPPIVNAAFSLVPPLMAALVLLSNRLLGLYYTALHTYCEEHQFPSPPPPMDDVIAAWQSAFNPARQDIESISCVAHGRAARQPMHINIEAQINDPKKPAIAPQNSAPRRAATGLISSSNSGPGSIAPRPSRIASTPSTPSTPGPRPPLSANSNLGIPTVFTTASGYGHEPGTSPLASTNSLQPQSDYFSGGGGSRSLRPPSAASSISTASATPSVSSVAAAAVVGKKKPPPPPPKRIGTNTKPDEFVVALYAFTGQSTGDLSFSEGDRIRVIKRTGTDQDWWVGELGGVKGSFPANYCKAT